MGQIGIIYYGGGVNGAYIVTSDLTKNIRTRISAVFKIDKNAFGWKIFSRIITFFLIVYTWGFFRADGIYHAFTMQKMVLKDFKLQYIFSNNFLKSFGEQSELLILLIVLLIVTCIDYWQYKNIDWKQKILSQQIVFRWIIYGILLFLILAFGVYGEGNEQTKFIYFQF